jgi:hypothetical protein
MSDDPAAFQPIFIERSGRRVGFCSATCTHLSPYQPNACRYGDETATAVIGTICQPWMQFQLDRLSDAARDARTQCQRAQQARDSAQGLIMTLLQERDEAREALAKMENVLPDPVPDWVVSAAIQAHRVFYEHDRGILKSGNLTIPSEARVSWASQSELWQRAWSVLVWHVTRVSDEPGEIVARDAYRQAFELPDLDRPWSQRLATTREAYVLAVGVARQARRAREEQIS